MRSTKRRSSSKRWAALVGGILLAGGFATSLAHWWQAEQLTVVGTNSSFSVALMQRGGKPWVSLNELLEKLGALEVSSGKDQDKLKLRFNSVEAEFASEKSHARIAGNSVDFSGRAVVENGRVLLPLAALPAVLPHFVNTSVNYGEASRRLFLGDAGIRFALELKKGDATELVLSFSTPVSPQISTEPGKLRMVFQRDPIAMDSQSWQFDDPVITSASYSDAAAPELVVSGSQPLLATFSDGGKTIAVVSAPELRAGSESVSAQEQAATPPPVAPSGATDNPASASPAPASTAASSARPESYLVVIDASHGGSERGASLSENLAEKDVTLAIALGLRKQLEERGLSSLMVREGDTTLAPDQRAVLANTSQASVYVAIHAGGLNRGVRVYTSMLSPAEAVSAPPVPWEKAQAGFVQSSRVVASAMLNELGKNRVRVPSVSLPAPLRPLNNITAAAVAVEVGPLNDDMETVSNPDYQQTVARGLAAALATLRPRLERRR